MDQLQPHADAESTYYINVYCYDEDEVLVPTSSITSVKYTLTDKDCNIINSKSDYTGYATNPSEIRLSGDDLPYQGQFGYLLLSVTFTYIADGETLQAQEMVKIIVDKSSC